MGPQSPSSGQLLGCHQRSFDDFFITRLTPTPFSSFSLSYPSPGTRSLMPPDGRILKCQLFPPSPILVLLGTFTSSFEHDPWLSFPSLRLERSSTRFFFLPWLAIRFRNFSRVVAWAQRQFSRFCLRADSWPLSPVFY